MVADKEMERLYKALANRRRVAIVRYLKSGNRTVGGIAAFLKLSVKSTSRHLQVLSSAGFVTSEQKGPYVHYSLDAKSGGFRILRAGLF